MKAAPMMPGYAAAALLAGLVILSAARALPASPKRAPAPLPRTYATACAPCHANNGFGVQALAKRLGKGQSVLTERSDLDPALIRLAVRHGIGAMPPMSRTEVSDRELDLIIATLTAKKKP